jgi:hypothetical protein
MRRTQVLDRGSVGATNGEHEGTQSPDTHPEPPGTRQRALSSLCKGWVEQVNSVELRGVIMPGFGG